MSNKPLLVFMFFAFMSHSYGQNSCDTIYSEMLNLEPSYKNNGNDLLQFFNNDLLEVIMANSGEDSYPSSFRMKLVINNKDEVESISEIKGNYSLKGQTEILEILRTEKGWKSGEINGQKVCSYYYFVVSCILWD